MGLKLLDGTIVDSSFTPMCFILIMANISRLLCMEVGMHKQVLDICAQQNFSRSFWWPPTLFARSGWYHLHCHFGSIAARWHRKHTLWSWEQTQPEFDWPFPIIVKEIFTDIRTVKTVVNLFSFDLLHKGLIRRSTRGKQGLIVSCGAGGGWLSALTMINAQSLPCLEVWMKGMKGWRMAR